MSIIKKLALQEVDNSDDKVLPNFFDSDDQIVLNEQIDEGMLDQYCDKVVEDIHEDPTWFNFDKK